MVSILCIREKEEEKNKEEKKRGIRIHALSSLTMTRQCRYVRKLQQACGLLHSCIVYVLTLLAFRINRGTLYSTWCELRVLKVW